MDDGQIGETNEEETFMRRRAPPKRRSRSTSRRAPRDERATRPKSWLRPIVCARVQPARGSRLRPRGACGRRPRWSCRRCRPTTRTTTIRSSQRSSSRPASDACVRRSVRRSMLRGERERDATSAKSADGRLRCRGDDAKPRWWSPRPRRRPTLKSAASCTARFRLCLP